MRHFLCLFGFHRWKEWQWVYRDLVRFCKRCDAYEHKDTLGDVYKGRINMTEHDCENLPISISIYEDSGKWLLEFVYERLAPIEVSHCPFCGEKLDE
jgi:hypothetical protein